MEEDNVSYSAAKTIKRFRLKTELHYSIRIETIEGFLDIQFPPIIINKPPSINSIESIDEWEEKIMEKFNSSNFSKDLLEKHETFVDLDKFRLIEMNNIAFLEVHLPDGRMKVYHCTLDILDRFYQKQLREIKIEINDLLLCREEEYESSSK